MSKRIYLKLTVLLISSLSLILGSLTMTTKAAPLSSHPTSSCYGWLAGGWNYDSSGNVNIKYRYMKNGTYDYTTRISNGINEWTSHFSFMKFSKVTTGNNLLILSTDFGDTGWVGKAYNSGSPKQININEWYHTNWDNYGYLQYERVVIHEIGHTFGLGHTSCTSEIMSNSDGRNISQVNLGDGDVSGIRDYY